MLRLNQVKTEAGRKISPKMMAAGFLKVSPGDIKSVKIVRRSVDARKKPEIFYIYTLDVEVKDQERVLRRFRGRDGMVSPVRPVVYRFPGPGERKLSKPPVIVGMGPAGLFCGYFLALGGYRPILLERGKCVEERQEDVERFWKTGRLDPSSNVQFGEGGAGAFSDGKLNTLVKDRDGRNGVVLETLVKFGAKDSILYEAKPHIGTDVLCRIVGEMRREILRLGGTVRFSCQVTGLLIQDGRISGVEVNGTETLACGQVVLACGHSARDTFETLYRQGVPMEAKSFAVGLRVEHLQSMINESQYGKADPGELGAASYKVTAQASDGRGVYSFCMCPGGYVVNASSEPGRTAVNGMSYSGRSGQNANSAVVVAVAPEDFGSDHPLAGVEFQRRLEEKAYELGDGKIPVQRYGDFRRQVEGEADESDGADRSYESNGLEGSVEINESDRTYRSAGSYRSNETNGSAESAGSEDGADSPQPQCAGAYVWADVSRILPPACSRAFVEGMAAFGRQIRGFDRPDTLVSGVESRTSSPVRISRDETLQSAVRGLYPCGEGAGYAGGITSAAMDGLRVAETIAAEYMPFDMADNDSGSGFRPDHGPAVRIDASGKIQ